MLKIEENQFKIEEVIKEVIKQIFRQEKKGEFLHKCSERKWGYADLFLLEIGCIEYERRNDMENNILVLGNGFDIAHGLKTKYEDFMDWVRGFNGNYSNLDPDDYAQKVINLIDIFGKDIITEIQKQNITFIQCQT